MVGPGHELAPVNSVWQVDWSPDGQRVAYVPVISDNVTAIFVVNVVGGTPVQITPSDWNSPVYLQFCWSPDSKRIAFNRSTYDDNPPGLFVVDRNGDNLRALGNGGTSIPQWSASTSTILFQRNIGDAYEGIWQIRPDGSGLQQLSNGADLIPEISPDGSKIAFVRQIGDGRRQLWTMDVDGANQQMIDEPPW